MAKENTGRVRLSRNALIIIVAAVVVVVAVACVLAFARPWDAGSSGAGDSGASGGVGTSSSAGSSGSAGASGGSSVSGGSGDSREPYWDTPESPASTDGLLTAYAASDGSAGPDFLGVSNTNFDFVDADEDPDNQYTGYSADSLFDISGAGLAIWATSVNESVNPYYANLFYNTVMGTSYPQATTWAANSDIGSWGDSNGSSSTDQE